VIIRKATKEDRAQLYTLLVKFDDYSQKLLSEKQKQFRARKNREEGLENASEMYVSDPGWIVFVAEVKDSLKGFIAGKINEKKYRLYNKEGYLNAWFMEKEFQNHGVGKQLFDQLLKEFKNAGCTHVVLDTNVENVHGIKIYEHLGFSKRLISFFKPLQEVS
jgi:ribosomal protein S18 acetylase RimI-like enzyme